MSTARHFLLVYRRSTGVLETCEDLGVDSGRALKRRFECEMLHRGDPDLEVVLLSAPSRAALEQTHARYFKSDAQLRAALRTSTS